MMECLIHERGIPCGKSRAEKIFPKPDDYVDFEIKWEIIKQSPDFRKPDSWPTASPPDQILAAREEVPRGGILHGSA